MVIIQRRGLQEEKQEGGNKGTDLGLYHVLHPQSRQLLYWFRIKIRTRTEMMTVQKELSSRRKINDLRRLSIWYQRDITGILKWTPGFKDRRRTFVGWCSNKNKGEGENGDKDRTDPGQPAPHHFTKSSVNILNTNSQVLKDRSDFFWQKKCHNSFNHLFAY